MSKIISFVCRKYLIGSYDDDDYNDNDNNDYNDNNDDDKLFQANCAPLPCVMLVPTHCMFYHRFVLLFI